MDSVLEHCWKEGVAPFDGATIFDASEGEISLIKLRQSTLAVINILEAQFPQAALLVLDDWHEHDGFISSSKESTWPEIRTRLINDEAFLYFKTDDFQVAKAVYPKGMQFYLRIYIDEESSSSEGVGEIDVTVPLQLATAIAEAFRNSGLTPKTESAKTYFDARLGG